MDMSSSEDEAEVKPPSNQLVPVPNKSTIQKQQTPKNLINKPENEEVVLKFIEFE